MGTSSWQLGGFWPYICFVDSFCSEGCELGSLDRLIPTWMLLYFYCHHFLPEWKTCLLKVCLCLLFLLLITYFVDTVNTNSSLRLPRFLFFRNDCQNSSTSLLHSFRFQCTLYSLSIPLCSSTSSSSIYPGSITSWSSFSALIARSVYDIAVALSTFFILK